MLRKPDKRLLSTEDGHVRPFISHSASAHRLLVDEGRTFSHTDTCSLRICDLPFRFRSNVLQEGIGR